MVHETEIVAIQSISFLSFMIGGFFPELWAGLQMAPGEDGCCKAAVVKVECGGQAS